MDTYTYLLELEIEVEAPSYEDGIEIVDDIFGEGELDNFDVRVIQKKVTG